jgi:DNA-binding MarR family transcriptional regulator
MAPNSYDIFEFSRAWVSTAHKMEALEKLPYDFGSGDILNHSEIHTIVAIGRHKELNITGLAEHLGVSKSAISQMIRKLLEKNLVERHRDPENEKEIIPGLTPRGKVAYLGHEQVHAKFDELMLQNIGPISDEEFENLKRFIDAIESTVDALLEKKV